MRRREFIALTGAATVWATGIRAQQRTLPVIGFLSGGTHGTRPLDTDAGIDGLRHGLADGGYIEGRNVSIEYRWAEGQFDRLPTLANELVAQRVALIATVTLPAALAAKAASPITPVVFVIGEDPVRTGLVKALSRPGSNATGVSDFVNQLGAKRLEYIRQAVPGAEMVGLLVNPNNPNAESDVNETAAAAVTVGQKLLVVKAATDAELSSAFTRLVEAGTGALCVNIDPFLFGARDQIIALAARHSLPAIYPLREFVTSGGLMSYSPNRFSSWRQAGLYAARILKGEEPAKLPVQQATKLELVINLNAAKAIALTLSPTLLAQADEVIE